MRTAAILPVKEFGEAKRRLGESVTPALHARLVPAMVCDVLDALSRCTCVERTILVTNERELAVPARSANAIVVPDTRRCGQSEAVSLGIELALREKIDRVVCVAGDCPALDPDELARLLDGHEAGVAIVPDRHGTGTNALALAPADAIAPSFGPGSRARHERLASGAGVTSRVVELASLMLDIDTGEDLKALRERLSGESDRAPLTRAALGLALAAPAASAARPPQAA
jgi:2-phospho-L-lactate guanylyltransferase